MQIFKTLKKEINKRPTINSTLIEEAYIFAREAHEGQFRKSGEPYIIHPTAVATMLAKIEADEESIIAALLHDTVEDTDVTLEQIEDKFGEGVATLVDGLTKIAKHHFRNTENLSVKIESLRKWLDIMQTDIRVAIIKLYDRLHNMETLDGHGNPEKQERISKETLTIFSKIAKKLSMNTLRRDLEDLCLRYIEKDNYKSLQNIRRQESWCAKKYSNIIQDFLNGADYQDVILGVEYQQTPFLHLHDKQVYDFQTKKLTLPYNFIITTTTIENCYYLLFLIHSLWKAKKNGFRDFITTPQSNGEQELRTTVLLEEGVNIQFKIRTREMHNYAQFGISRFCFSKQRNEQAIPWIRYLSYVTQIETENSESFFEKMQNDIIGDLMIVYTETDEPVIIPSNATALDAAFYVYQEKAYEIASIAVNGETVPINTALQENDTVHFFFDKKMTIHSKWNEYVNCALAEFLIEKGLKKRPKLKI